ncbi:DUF4169 family protein [Paracoccus bogoriensis]|uniref:DUF4169 family protein n=1 Tax=Paracoccus bogoriensis TaxID=242065 RepID=UPI001CA4E9EA|nr:DUF4169 family protein [Paracoccus bogoriensis]MBW7056640.1 DUF4169 family protein [Paracoccus bogoriensis]
MTKPINLRQFRKNRARAQARAAADANAARHGEPRALREAREARAELDRRRLEGHRTERDDA